MVISVDVYRGNSPSPDQPYDIPLFYQADTKLAYEIAWNSQNENDLALHLCSQLDIKSQIYPQKNVSIDLHLLIGLPEKM
jgi:hypothetical protein